MVAHLLKVVLKQRDTLQSDLKARRSQLNDRHRLNEIPREIKGNLQ